jgi:hypothetical protein
MKINTIMGYNCPEHLLKACEKYLEGDVYELDMHELGGLLTMIMKKNHLLKNKFLELATYAEWDIVLVTLIRDELKRD